MCKSLPPASRIAGLIGNSRLNAVRVANDVFVVDWHNEHDNVAGDRPGPDRPMTMDPLRCLGLRE